MTKCIEFTNMDHPVLLEQEKSGKQLFRVTYGQQVKTGLTYFEAAHELGECILHSLCCAGLINNSEA